MSDRFDADAIVVGSGFGGAVAAARLAQAGHDVVVLERGRRWQPGSFPREPQLDRGWLWQADQGLYDVRWLDSMLAVQAAGWGGGSLAYANVFVRPSERALDDRWPASLRRDELDPYYDLAAHMLGVAPVGDDPRTGRAPARTTLIENFMATGDRRETTVRPNLAVTFGDPDTWRPNRHGVAQRGCAFVGECVIGCNQGAKNSLDFNYLAVAEANGARAFTDAEVFRIERRGDGYAVSTRAPSDPGAPPRVWSARRVVLSAGAVATTELLLRARDVHRTLPALSPHLGRGFSGNGDFLTVAEVRGDRPDMTTGPTITTNTVLEVPEGGESVWFQVQDGAYPVVLHELLDNLVLGPRARTWWRRYTRTADPRRIFTVLAMGHDSGNGILRLDRKGRVMLSWRNRWQAHLYRSQRRVGPLLARMLGARIDNPVTWSLLRRTTTVHPLGGVRPGSDASTSVVDEVGEVHGYPGLFVMDGSVLPASTGVNPSATILAAAERSIETIVRRTGTPRWRAPEWDDVQPATVPEDAAFAAASSIHERTRGGGIDFRERMAVGPCGRPHAVMRVRARTDSIERFFADPAHALELTGDVDVAGVVSGPDATGSLSLFPSGTREAMVYNLAFTGDDDQRWQLAGSKTVTARTPFGLLRDLTRLRAEISPIGPDPRELDVTSIAGSPGEPSRARRVQVRLRIDAADLLSMLASIRGSGFTRLRRVLTVARFCAFFARSALGSLARRV